MDTYFDYAATTPLSTECRETMNEYSDVFYNPSSLYRSSVAAKTDLHELRVRLAKKLQVQESEVVFTSGATEANNLVLRGIADSFECPHVLISAVEHSSIYETARSLAASGRIELDIVAVLPSGRVDMADLAAKVTDQTVLVSVIHTNNETGVVQSMRKLHEVIAATKAKRSSGLPLYFHTDAAQSAVTQLITAKSMMVDLMTINGSKLYGPKASGCLVKRRHVQLSPQITGGGQEFGMRSGTENLALIAGFVQSFVAVQGAASQEHVRLQSLQSHFEEEIIRSIDGVEVVGAQATRSPHISSLLLPGLLDGESFVMLLNERYGYEIASGAACGANMDEPSHVLVAMGYSSAQVQSHIRVSFGRNTTRKSIDELLKSMSLTYNELRSIS